MYTTCMFCEKDLGENELLETFPVGRRLAFDAAKGRLWVVCRRCERWNLSPLEERWEAVESCERLFRDTRLRVSTENIGMARHPEGLELVRIGEPVRGEFAAWRYGDQFGRRRKKAIVYGVAGTVILGGVWIGGMAAGAISAGLAPQLPNLVHVLVNGRTVARVRTEDGELLKLKRSQLAKVRIRSEDEGWTLSLKSGYGRAHRFTGGEAERVAGLIMPAVNRTGGNEKRIRDAVRLIERAGHPERFLEDTVDNLGSRRYWDASDEKGGLLSTATHETKLALEMALHEERERRAMEGELSGLERIWRHEEEIAAIADDLLVPDDARARLEGWREA